ncbi:MAG TPA: YihY/virulence factor BrkB family protein [Anaerolineae bacterium]|nr:YihY/virulence factor BrkB family protein [Anaerolineae bacterium]
MHRLSAAWQRWIDIIWDNRLKLVKIWVQFDGKSNGWLGVCERAYKGFSNHQGNANAAATAYYTLFSVFPLTLLLISLGSFVLDSEEAQRAALAAVGTYLPAAVELVESNIQRVLQLRGTASVVGLVGFIWAASGVFGSLSRGINKAWDLQRPRPAWAERILAAGLVLLIGLLFSLSLLSTAAFELVGRLAQILLPETGLDGLSLLTLASTVLPYIFTVLLFAFLYAILPSTMVRWREALPGALLASFAWEVAKNGFTVYVGRFASYSLVYGSLGAVIAMLLWSYMSAMIILLGAEFTVQYARRMRGEAPPVSYVEPKRG